MASNAAASATSYPYGKKPLTVCVTGAAGQIGYALCPLIASGQVFGDTPVNLVMLDIPPAEKALGGVAMELQDGAYPNLLSVRPTVNVEDAFVGCDVVVFVGGFPRKKGMLRADLIEKNCGIFVTSGKALEKHAPRHVKVVVVANPANTNCYILSQAAPSIPRENFTALTRLDLNRARGILGNKLGLPSTAVKNVIIWGNHSKSQYPDVRFGTVAHGDGRHMSISEAVKDDAWLAPSSPATEGRFVHTVQYRGAAVIAARGLSSAMSAANAVKDHLRDWLSTGTPHGEHVSMAVVSDGSYGVTKGLLFSFPVTCEAGSYRIVQGLPMDDASAKMLKATEEELLSEREDANKVLAKL